MEKYTVSANMNGRLSQTPTFHATLPISLHSKPHHTPPPFPSRPNPTTPLPVPDSELSIFGAERYFSDNSHDHKTPNKLLLFDPLSPFPRDSSGLTPTASSEASWNSQSGLLSKPPGSAAVTLRSLPPAEPKKSSSAYSWIFCRSCPCTDKRSVDVVVEEKEKDTGPKSPNRRNYGADVVPKDDVTKLKVIAGGWENEKKTVQSPTLHRIVNSGVPFADAGGFTFPILTKPAVDTNDPPRDSLEVFRPKEDDPAKPPLELQRWKQTSFNTRRSFGFPASPKRRVDDDVASDSSSDLFEIESFSTTGPVYRRRDSLDEILAMNTAGILQLRRGGSEDFQPARPSDAPSEVSVQWSVTTAEGFANFSSAASEYEDAAAFMLPELEGFGGKKKGSGLLSCRSEKAVNVGPQPVRCAPEQRRPARSNGGKVDKMGSERPPLARSHSARLTRPIQTR